MSRNRIRRAIDCLFPKTTFSKPLRNGRSLRLYRQFSSIYAFDYDLATASQLLDLVSTTDSFWDIGAHVGYWSLWMALHAPREISIEAFEPNPSTFSWLNRHFRVNRLGAKVRAHRLALSDRIGEFDLKFEDMEATSTLVQNAAEHLKLSKSLLVNVSTVDALLQASPQFQAPSLIKIDCEGHELRVLQGASATLDRYHPKIILEIHPWHMGLIGDTPQDLAKFLEEHGYRMRRLCIQENGILTHYVEPKDG